MYDIPAIDVILVIQKNNFAKQHRGAVTASSRNGTLKKSFEKLLDCMFGNFRFLIWFD